jgi:integrase/recombinase XerD
VNPMEQALNDYVSLRHSLGFRFQVPEILLRSFVAFLQTEGAPYITRELGLRWATQPAKVQPFTWAQRLGMVRRFAIWLSASDPRTEIPAADLLPHRYQRKPPHIYREEEIERLLRQAQQLRSPRGLRAHTFATLFGLLAVTGMRLGETLGLDRPDVDLDLGILHIRKGKWGKSRYVPVHASTVEALKAYAEARDRLFPAPPTPAFFLSERGRRITNRTADRTFARLSQQIGLRIPAKRRSGRGPRLHDLRHHFAVQTLVHWYRAGLDVERELPKLSTYLGHVHTSDTYWYLEAVPELLQLATDRLIPREVSR